MKRVVLCVLDGWGESTSSQGNAIALARTPVWDSLRSHYPTTHLEASGVAVGLPVGQMGNSEVGHMTLGLGRIVLQDLPRIDSAIDTGSFLEDPQFVRFVQQVKQGTKRCHILGLLSSGGVHSHIRHIQAFSKAFVKQGLEVCIHAFLDGRDTSPHSGFGFVKEFIQDMTKFPQVRLVTLGGRYYGMDRDHHWDRVSKAFEAIIEGNAPSMPDPAMLIQDYYRQGITDEFIPPHRHEDYHGFEDGDGLFVANFRADRVRQLLSALLLPNFSEFKRSRSLHLSASLGLGTYTQELIPYIPSLFPKQDISESLGEVISQAQGKQLRLAETEKYPHVTFFFNGGREDPFPGEDRILIPSPRVKTYDLCPEMSAETITDKAIEAISNDKYSLIVMNYANPDMVGHTGVQPAILKAIEKIDNCLGRLVKAVKQVPNTILLITADHGNAELMESEGSVNTAHTTNPVPLILVNGTEGIYPGSLADVAPTILDLLGLPIPAVMQGHSLLQGGHHV